MNIHGLKKKKKELLSELKKIDNEQGNNKKVKLLNAKIERICKQIRGMKK